jgi:hypothetical protein
MADLVYTPAKKKILDGEIDFGANDIRVALLMANTTGDTDEDAEFISNIGTLDEMDGGNYARVAMAGEIVNVDTANNRAEFDANDTVFPLLGIGTRQVAGILIYKHVTNDSNSIAIAWIDSPPTFPLNANGRDWRITWNAQGVLQLA